MSTIVTINRQFGSGGREVGKRLADALQSAYYDKELLSEIAKQTGLHEGYINLYDETATRNYGFTFSRSFATYQQSPQDKVQIAFSKIIKEISKKGDAVIIGRCAEHILHEENPFKVFIYASDMNFRVERCFEKVPEDRKAKTKEDMVKMILDVDKKRKKYHEYYTPTEWLDMLTYNLCIDTSVVGVKGAVEIIVKALEKANNQ